MIVAKKSFCFSFSRSLSLSLAPTWLLSDLFFFFFFFDSTLRIQHQQKERKTTQEEEEKGENRCTVQPDQLNESIRFIHRKRVAFFLLTVYCFHRRNRLSILDMRHTFSLSLHLIHFLVSRFLRFTSHHYLYSIAYRLVHWWTYSISTRWVCWQREIFFSLAIEFEQKRIRISLSRSLSLLP